MHGAVFTTQYWSAYDRSVQKIPEVPEGVCSEATHEQLAQVSLYTAGGHGGRVVTLSPPTSEAGVRFLARPQVGKLVVACCWSAVYSTKNPDELYILVSSALPTTRRDMTCTVLKAT